MKSAEVKKAVQEVLLEHLNEVQPQMSAEDRELYRKGVVLGASDKLKAVTRRLSPDKLPQAFIDGYNSVRREGWWTKFNSKLTDYLARLGSSNLR